MLTGEHHARSFPITLLTSFCILSFSLISMWSTIPAEETTSLQVSEGKWHIYVVDNTKGSGSSSSIAIDSKDNPHVAYHHYQNGSLNYVHWDGASWHSEVIDWEDNTGFYPSMAIDSKDNIHLAYYTAHSDSGRDFELRYAHFNGSSWAVQTVDGDSEYNVGMWPSLALNSSGSPSISYNVDKWPSSDSDLRYSYWNGSSWTTEKVMVGGDAGSRSSLDMDQNDHPHISYRSSGGLNYAYWSGSSWIDDKVAPRDSSWMSMKLNKTGEPVIAFNHNEPAVKPMILKYAVRSNGSWKTTEIDGANDPAVSLALENQEFPHISYYSVNNTLKHAYFEGESWMTEVVDNASLVGAYSSIALDQKNDLYISYSDYSNETLRLATTRELEVQELGIEIDIDPDTLNLKSKGKFMTAYIELEGADVREIDASSILLNGAISPVLDKKYGFVTSENSYILDHDNDGIMERMVKFDRAEVQRMLTPVDEVVLTITGSLDDGTGFEGNDTVKVINPP